MRRVVFMTLFLFAVAAPLMAQDPVKVDAKHYKVEFENSSVRVLRINYGPREKSVMHYHRNAFAIFQTDGHVKFTYPDGRTEEREFKAGQTVWTPGGRHLPENMADTGFEVILVEIKPARRPKAKKPVTASPTPQ